MKSLLVFLRIITVGLLWGIVFTEGLRVIMLCNWHFDMFWPDHWRQAIALWKAGWVVRAPKEWAFVLLIFTYIPMLLTGWWTLSLVAWEDIIAKIIKSPYTLWQKLKSPAAIQQVANRYGIVKRKSYKQIRPAGINTLRVPISDYGSSPAPAPSALSSVPPAYSATPSFPSAATHPAEQPKKTDVAATIDHALFKFDDDDDDDFDLDIDSFEKTDIKKKKETPKPLPKFDFDDADDDDDDDLPDVKKPDGGDFVNVKQRDNKRGKKQNAPKDANKRDNSRNTDKKRKENKAAPADQTAQASTSRGPVYDSLVQKNYDIISNIAVAGTVIDFVGASDDNICLCLADKESGDWLADEEMFNGEDPLWFSENAHRVSPVCLLGNARKIIKDKLEEAGFTQKLESFVVIQAGNIINADDMFETWNEEDIKVTRTNRGAPKELYLFSKTLPEAGDKLPAKDLERLTNILKNLK